MHSGAPTPLYETRANLAVCLFSSRSSPVRDWSVASWEWSTSSSSTIGEMPGDWEEEKKGEPFEEIRLK